MRSKYLLRVLVITSVISLVSCRCSTDYKAVSNDKQSDPDTALSATAMMWQGKSEYLGIQILINRSDSLFVKNVLIDPAVPKGKFYPKFSHFTMYSFYYGDSGTLGYKGQYIHGDHWQDYLAETFEQLPKENRRTNRGNSHIAFTANYDSETSINFDSFSADVEVQLIDKLGNTITHKRHFNFYGKKKCWFSAH